MSRAELPVLLVPGGAVFGAHAFPGLTLDGPVLVEDRPLTAIHLAEQVQVVADRIRHRGPVIVVGHSLGGPAAIQLALDHPDLVAGLVLLDPTPFNDSSLVGRTVKTLPLFRRALRLPVLGGLLARLSTRGHSDDPDVVLALAEMVEDAQMDRLQAVLTHFVEDAALLTSRLTAAPLALPGLIATAERSSGSAVTKAHQQMGQLTGVRVESWKGTAHTMHLQRPDLVSAAVADLRGALTDVG